MNSREEEALKATKRSREGLRLPPEMVSEILVRLPAASIIRFRAACRLFAAVTSDPSFITSHTLRSRAAPASLIFEASPASPPPHRPVYLRLNGRDRRREDEGWEPAPMRLVFPPKAGPMTLVTSCDGLLCFSISRYNHHYICNPLTREWLAVKNCKADAELCGFYSHPPSGDHRLLYKFPSGDRERPGLRGFEVFSLGTNGWRRIEDSHCRPPCCTSRGAPVPFRGSLHWLAHAGLLRLSVTIFDMKTERFRQAPAPEGVCASSGKLAELGGRLHLFRVHPLGPIGIWFLEDYERMAWVKHGTIDIRETTVLQGVIDCIIWPVTARDSRELVLWHRRPSGQEALVSCDIHLQRYWTLEITGLIPWKISCLRGVPYVESLVSYKSFKKLIYRKKV